MPMPPETQQLIEQALTTVRNDPQHTLNLYQRFAIYYSFGNSRYLSVGYSKDGNESNFAEWDKVLEEEFAHPSPVDFALGWLAILSAKKVQPVWEKVWKQIAPDKYKKFLGKGAFANSLQSCEKLLLRQLTYQEGADLFYEITYWVLQDAKHGVTYDIASAYQTLYDAIGYALIGPLPRGQIVVEGKLPENIFIADPAYSAGEAYSTIDENVLGEGNWNPPPKPIKYDLSKRLEFWEWWLTEAIPQAWELTEINSK